jgi:hypothetical protein
MSKKNKEEYSEKEIKAFNKGWGRAVGNTIHWLRFHEKIEFDKENFIEYMKKKRKKSLQKQGKLK